MFASEHLSIGLLPWCLLNSVSHYRHARKTPFWSYFKCIYHEMFFSGQCKSVTLKYLNGFLCLLSVFMILFLGKILFHFLQYAIWTSKTHVITSLKTVNVKFQVVGFLEKWFRHQKKTGPSKAVIQGYTSKQFRWRPEIEIMRPVSKISISNPFDRSVQMPCS